MNNQHSSLLVHQAIRLVLCILMLTKIFCILKAMNCVAIFVKKQEIPIELPTFITDLNHNRF
jgi:hypothetical protein